MSDVIAKYLKKWPVGSNWIHGTSSATSIWPPVEARSYPYVSDADAIRQDWVIVGEDLRESLENGTVKSRKIDED